MPRQHLSLKRITKERRKARLPVIDRPVTRGDCKNGPRPCPYVGCRHHLLLETKDGALRLLAENPSEMRQVSETCSLDVADQGPLSLPEVASLLGVSRQRVSQIEIAALRELRKQLLATAGREIEEFLPNLFRDAEV